MRCPKCGYISFDNQESCRKCRKPVKFTEDLEGVIFAVQSPLFLDLDGGSNGDRESVDTFAADKTGETEPVSMDGDDELDMAEIEIDFGEEDDQLFSLELDHGKSDIQEIDLSEDDHVSETVSFDSTSLNEEQEGSGLQLDFADIDISDLAPPEAKSIDADTDDEVGIDFAKLESSPAVKSKSATTSGAGLDDLLVEGLDLDGPTPPVAGSKSSHMLRPSLKTGTALDDFEVDLDELITEER